MNILITAGGTSEEIDDVRKITNMATGRLGSLIADCFLENKNVSVTFICSRNSARPKLRGARIVPVENVRSLLSAVETEMRGYRYDAVIHSMAVSDYKVKYSVSAENFAAKLASSIQNIDFKEESLEQHIKSVLLNCTGTPHTGKLSSDAENLFLCLEKTPKVIGMFKKLQPATVLVGFKLLSGVEKSELLRAAEKQIKQNNCDFVLANDLKNIGESHHGAILLGRDHSVTNLSTKEEIAEEIKLRVIRQIREDMKK